MTDTHQQPQPGPVEQRQPREELSSKPSMSNPGGSAVNGTFPRSAASPDSDVQGVAARAYHQRSVSLSAGPYGARSASAIDQYRPRLSGSPIKGNPADRSFPAPQPANGPLSPDSPLYSPSPFSYPLGNGGNQSPEVDAKGAALLQSARIRVSSRDQEAMRRMRSVLDQSDSASASSSPRSDTPPSPLYPSSHDGQDHPHQRSIRPSSRHTRTASTLSQVLATAGEAAPVTGPSADQTEAGLRDAPEAGPSRLGPGQNVDYSIVVVGAAGVGKSTFIAKALRSWGQVPAEDIQLRNGRRATRSLSQVQPGRKFLTPFTFEIIEMDIQAMDLEGEPNGPPLPQELPLVHGVVLCYDSSRQETIKDVAAALERFIAAGLCTVLLACKTDPDQTPEVDPWQGNALGEKHNVGLIEVTSLTTEGRGKMKNGLRWLLYKIEQRHRRQQRSLSSAQNSISATSSPSFTSHAYGTASPGRTESTPPSSRMSIADTLPSPPHFADVPVLQDPAQVNFARRSISAQDAHAEGRRQSSASGRASHVAPRLSIQTDGQDRRSSAASMAWVTGGVGKGPGSTNLPRTRSEADLLAQDELGMPAPSPYPHAKSAGVNPPDSALPTAGSPQYLSLREIFSLVFSSIVSTEDDTLVQAFFMTYRRFCRPSDVMKEFLRRYKSLAQYDGISPDVRSWALIKMTGALIEWTTTYPGDLEDETTQAVFRETLAIVLRHTSLASLASDLSLVEANLFEAKDVDRTWALKTGRGGGSSRPATPRSISGSSIRLARQSPRLRNGDSPTSPPGGTRPNSVALPPNPESEPAPSATASRVSLTSPSRPSSSASNVRLMRTPSSSRPGTSHGDSAGKHDQMPHYWTQAFTFVISTDPRSFALELTKLQWELFRAVRARDVLRHCLGKERADPVGTAVAFFNHLSRWISTLVLANPKPKHRARVYERFVFIANHLRQLNNYDSMYAVMAGLRETSVHRLSQTHALVQLPTAVQQEYDAAVSLMDPRGGYHAYREVLKADLRNGAAVIPLLTTMIGLVNRLQAVRPEDVREEDGRIQWDKFAKFGEYLSIIPECQAKGAPVLGTVSPALKAIIQETPVITDEDGLFERSRVLEPPTGQGSGPGSAGGNVLRRLAGLGL